MWDGRELSLFSQAVDATLTHAQAAATPSPAQQQQIVTFEGCTRADTPSLCANTPQGSGVFTAQIFDKQALYLAADGAWSSLTGHSPAVSARVSIARGEQIFNTTKINITGVAGLNDVLNQPSIAGFCGTCHDTPFAGNHSVKAPLNIGVAGAGLNSPPALDISGLPVFTLLVHVGTAGRTDRRGHRSRRALITGQCADIGKLKGPILRGLAARAPYFHNGSAATLQDVVEFYDQRFNIGLTNQEKTDLAAFLNSL